MRRAIRDSALSIAFGIIFLAALAGQSVAGFFENNEDLVRHGKPPIEYLDFVSSSDFLLDVAENWQSEYLQFFLFILATVWLVQRGSPESKKPGDEGVGSDKSQLVGRFARKGSPSLARENGILRSLYSNSLLLVMGAIFVLSWLAQSLAGTVVMNAILLDHGEPQITWAQYLVSPEFWNRTLQNWQSEFLAVGSMIAFTIFLRQRGSSESKPVGVPNYESATEAE